MDFSRNWTAEVLRAPPPIAPVRSYTWPMAIAGEEDALARGALNVMVKPAGGGSFLATAALGFRDPSMPSGVWPCPNPDEICVVAGGYGYVASVLHPESVTLLGLKPVVSVREAPENGLLLFAGFTTVLAWGVDGLAWQTGRLSWEGLRVTVLEGGVLRGFGWDLMADAEVEFEVELATGEWRGGGYRVR